MALVARNTWMRVFSAPFERLPGTVDVLFQTAGQAANHGPIAELAGDLANGLEVPRRSDGKTGLNHIDAEIDERPGNFQLFGRVHAAAGRLLSVAQRRVENRNFFGRHRSVLQGSAFPTRGGTRFQPFSHDPNTKNQKKKPRDRRVSGFCISQAGHRVLSLRPLRRRRKKGKVQQQSVSDRHGSSVRKKLVPK